MAYKHIDNLYKNQEILMFKECWAMEKIHGTSAHIAWKNGVVKFFSGGVKHELFLKIFDADELKVIFETLGLEDVVIYGEAHGGNCQAMSDTYGKELRFVTFEVKIGNAWLCVPAADEFLVPFGLEFVSYNKISTDIESIDRERDSFSIQAERRGIEGKQREGVVLRPLIELRKNNGERIVAKHKSDNFRETHTKRKIIDPDKLKILSEANAIADEWVTPMRLSHILGKIEAPSMNQMGDIIKSMIEDVKREGDGEIVWYRDVGKAIGSRTAQMVKAYFQERLRGKKNENTCID